MPTIADELQSLTPSAKLRFYTVDATALGAPAVYRFHNYRNPLSANVVWQGVEYQAIAVEATGFETRADGSRPRPLLTVGDVFGALAAAARELDDLRGAALTIKTTHLRFLDAVNFAGGMNAEADPDAHYPDEVWVFDRVVSRDGSHVQWELVCPLDLEDVMLPARQVRNGICGSRYRSSECGYTGGPRATADDVVTSDMALDDCSLRVSGCKLRFGPNAELPIDFFPGVGTVRQQ